MVEPTQKFTRFDKYGRERYMLIHKRPVGPKTAEGLFSLYEQLSSIQAPREMYMAGWAALEASMVGTELPSKDRVWLVDSAEDAWMYALALQQERAAEKAWLRDVPPDTTAEYRIAGALSTIPVFRELPLGKPRKQTMRSSYEKLLAITECNQEDLERTEEYARHLRPTSDSFDYSGRAANHRGLLYEQLSQLGVNRLHSSAFFATSSFARSDNGRYYPDQTHDNQCLYLHGGEIVDVIPLEVKTRLRKKFFHRYKNAGLISGTVLTHDGNRNTSTLIAQLRREAEGLASKEDKRSVEGLTEDVIHSIRHFKRPERAGIHCREPQRCVIGKTALTYASCS